MGVEGAGWRRRKAGSAKKVNFRRVDEPKWPSKTHLDPSLLRLDASTHVRELRPDNFALEKRLAKDLAAAGVLE